MQKEVPSIGRMYANTVRFRYKSSQDAEQAIERVRDVAAPVSNMPGFIDFTFVRTGDTETLTIVRFDTKSNADAARERILPRVREAIASFMTGEPEVRPGEVAIEFAAPTQGTRASTTQR